MSILSGIYTFIIGPLELFFEILYAIAYRLIGNPGTSIVFLSLAMNFLVLPLYMRADEMQNAQIRKEKELQARVKQIKKTFKGDERFMILQTYYRQNDYKPTQILRGSVSLFLEIPFFIAAYHFLSNLELLKGVSFGPIVDLGSPDGLIVIGGMAINALPILMTLINIVSTTIYCKGAPLKSKIQLYGIAVIFLVFLYNSPAGLVFYWTLNNLFSLIKNVFYELENPRKVLSILSSAFGIVCLILGLVSGINSVKLKALIIIMALVLQIPLIKLMTKKELKITYKEPKRLTFTLVTLFLGLMCGVFIPSMLIKTSPSEFVGVANLDNPTYLIIHCALLSLGTFVLWFGVFYALADNRGKRVFEVLMLGVAAVTAINFFILNKDLGNINTSLKFDKAPSFSMNSQLLGLLIAIAVIAAVGLIYRKFPGIINTIVIAGVIAMVAISAINITGMQAEIKETNAKLAAAEQAYPKIPLSKEGKNVVVIMLDRGVNCYVPYIMNEKPELKAKFSGFTNYSNTTSFGMATNVATPALFGGYEYTPEEMNKRSNESLESKHNEALKVMPVLFSQKNYSVTVCDPPYAGYDWIPDLSIYDEYEGIDAYITQGVVRKEDAPVTVESTETVGEYGRNLFCYSLFVVSPECFKGTIYNGGYYNDASKQNKYQSAEEVAETKTNEQSKTSSKSETQNTEPTNPDENGKEGSGVSGSGLSIQKGIRKDFMNSYNVLEALPEITKISDGSKNTFAMLDNDITHSEMLLQEPEYEPKEYVDNTEYDKEHSRRYDDKGNYIDITERNQAEHYQVNMAAMLKLGEWFDYLRENGVYDNTRIIIVSDHGTFLNHRKNFYVGEVDLMGFESILMVKDFNATEYTDNNDFMTIADVPTLATKNLISNPTNPFTKKKISSKDKETKPVKVLSTDYRIDVNNGNTFIPGQWWTVHGNVHDGNNWKVIG